VWKECIALSRVGIFLAFSCPKDSFNKVNSKRIGNALGVAYPFFNYLQRSLWEYQGQGDRVSADNPVPIRVSKWLQNCFVRWVEIG